MDISAFEARFAAEGADPAAVVALLAEAMFALESDEQTGTAMMKVVLSKRLNPREEIRRLRANPDIARSYLGGTPEGEYQDAAVDKFRLDGEYSARAQGVDYPEPGQAKLFVACGGADRPRPIQLARNNAGLWKVVNFSSLTVGVKPRPSVAGDF